MGKGGRVRRFIHFREISVLKKYKNIERWQKSPSHGPQYCMCLYKVVRKTPCGV